MMPAWFDAIISNWHFHSAPGVPGIIVGDQDRSSLLGDRHRPFPAALKTKSPHRYNPSVQGIAPHHMGH
tara:strand:- start:1538 stop:1744 length:207 start_codon:yes stop_codon:yes gene_type:complete